MSVRLLIVAVAACCSSGCVAMYTTRPVELVATNAKTGEPVADLPLSTLYRSMGVLNRPNSEQGATDGNGRVVLPMADFESGIILLQAHESQRMLSVLDVRNGGTCSLSRPTADDPKGEVVVRLVPRPWSLKWWLFGTE